MLNESRGFFLLLPQFGGRVDGIFVRNARLKMSILKLSLAISLSQKLFPDFFLFM